MTYTPNPRTLRTSYLVFRMVLGAVLLISSFPGAVASAATGRWHFAALAGVESVGAVLFLLPRTLRVGGVLLLLTLGIAFITHALHGEFAGHVLVYAAGTFFVMTQGAGENVL